MASDVYIEQIVKRKDKWYRFPMYFLYVLGVLGSIILIFFQSWAFLILVAAVLVTLFTWRYFSVEFEYIFVTGELSIDKICTKSMRKKGRKLEMSEVLSVDLKESDSAKRILQSPKVKAEDYSSGYGEAPVVMITFNDRGETKYLLFEPNDAILTAIRHSIPGKVHITP